MSLSLLVSHTVRHSHKLSSPTPAVFRRDLGRVVSSEWDRGVESFVSERVANVLRERLSGSVRKEKETSRKRQTDELVYRWQEKDAVKPSHWLWRENGAKNNPTSEREQKH